MEKQHASMREYYYDHDGPWLFYEVWVDNDEEPMTWPPPGPYHVADTCDMDDQKLIVGCMPYLPGRNEHPGGEKNTAVGEVENLWHVAVIDETALQVKEKIVFNAEFPCPEWWNMKANRPTEEAFHPDQMYLEIDWTETVRERRRVDLEFPIYYNAGFEGLVRYTVDEQYKYPGASRRQVKSLRKTVVRINHEFQSNSVIVKSTRVLPHDLGQSDYHRFQDCITYGDDPHGGSCTPEEFNEAYQEALEMLNSL